MFTDDAYSLSKVTYDDGTSSAFRHYGPHTWRFRDGTSPAGVSQADTIDSIERAMRNITFARNDCNRPDNVDVQQDYAGLTDRTPNVAAGAVECRDGDNHSVVAFGDAGNNSTLAFECTWVVPHAGRDEIVSSDIKFDTSGHNWYDSGACTNEWNIVTVATHEAGHAFGLGHVREDLHGYLTMSPSLEGACKTPESTLGLGDMLGLEDLY